MEIAELINHPELLDRDTLYELRSTLALYPYFQTARLLLLQNLFLLHDPSFDEELRQAAIYISDRRVIFQMIEARHYQLATDKSKKPEKPLSKDEQDSRTLSLIDNFLESLPKEEDEPAQKKIKRKPTPADAAVDYVAYLLESESEEEHEESYDTPLLKGHSLIDSFIENDKGKIVLNSNPTLRPDIETDSSEESQNNEDNGYFTETLARIYIKQGRYSQALEIIRHLNLHNSKKNTYFADQIRFLEKLIINNNKK